MRSRIRFNCDTMPNPFPNFFHAQIIHRERYLSVSNLLKFHKYLQSHRRDVLLRLLPTRWWNALRRDHTRHVRWVDYSHAPCISASTRCVDAGALQSSTPRCCNVLFQCPQLHGASCYAEFWLAANHHATYARREQTGMGSPVEFEQNGGVRCVPREAGDLGWSNE